MTTEPEQKTSSRSRSKSGRKLVNYVHVPDPETGFTRIFGPDDDVPDKYAELITNPKAWDDYEPIAPQVPTEDVETPGPNQFAGEGGVALPAGLTKSQLYGMDKEVLKALAEDNGIDTSNLESKQELVEAITAR